MAPDANVKCSAGPVRGPRTLPLVFGADREPDHCFAGK
jgi:hypothetical protein